MAEDQYGRIAGMIMPEVDKVREQGAANFPTTLIIELATISLLIDAGITTTEAAVQRIEQIQTALSETFRSNEVSQRVARAIHLLRDQKQIGIPPCNNSKC